MTVTRIPQFKHEYAFLSNFFATPILHEGRVYPTAEHLFQALKTCIPTEQERVRTSATPSVAKRLGRRVTLCSNWQNMRDEVMRYVVEQKFTQNRDLQQKLLATGDAELCEGNTWGDTYWGCSLKTREGLNKLGQILMVLREQLQADASRCRQKCMP